MRDRSVGQSLRDLIWLVLCAIVWLGPTTDVRADDPRFGTVKLDLRPEAGAEVPTHLCVVSEAESDLARQRLWELLDAPEDYDASKPQTTPSSWMVKPSVWRGDAASVEQYRCGDDPLTDCRPRVEVPRGLTPKSDLFVYCSPDALADGGSVSDPRPMFILLSYLGGSPPQIESVQLEGGVAQIGVYGVPLTRVIVTARSLGGHYLPDARSEKGTDEGDPNSSDKRPTEAVQLSIAPRCRTVEVRLPRTKVKPADRDRLDVRVHGIKVDTDKCVANIVGSDVIQVRVPPAPLNVGSIDVLLRKKSGAEARFGADYEGRWPKIPFSLEFNQVTFTWRPPQCIYPEDSCPVATLDGGTVCEAERMGEICAYRCPGEWSEEAAVDLELPLGVEFEKDDPRQTWTDTLAKNGQELSSYVGSDQVYLVAPIHGWKTAVPDNNINEVEIYGEDGTARRYGVANLDRLVLKIPGATIRGTKGKCESIRYRPAGDRGYEELVGKVGDGKIDMKDPERGARVLTFNLSLLVGGGPAFTGAESPPIYFTGMGMFGIQLRPRRGPVRNRFAFEMQIGGTLGTWGVTKTEDPTASTDETPPTRDPDPDADQPAEDAETETRIGWARVLFEPAMVASLHERVQIGVGAGLGFSLPFRQRDVDLRGANLNFIYSPKVDFRFRLRRWIRLVLQFRYVGGEPAIKLEEDEQDPNNPNVDRKNASSFIILAGLQFRF